MKSALLFSDDDMAAQLAAALARAEEAEAKLAASQAQVAALEQQLATSASSAQRHHTQLAALVQNLRMGLVLVDHQGQIQFVNHHFWELFDLKPVPSPLEGGGAIPVEALAIHNAFQDPEAFRKRAYELHDAGQTVVQEEFELADGRVVELDYLVLDTAQAGRLICYRDVTERRLRDTELLALSHIPQQNANPILQMDPAGEVHYANAAAAPLVEALAAETDGTFRQRLLALVNAAPGAPAEQEELTAGAQHYLATVVAVPGQAYVTLYFTNITARLQDEQRLAEQRAFYEGVLEQVPVAVAVFDEQHRYVFLNPVVEPDPAVRARMLGKTYEEAAAFRLRPQEKVQQRAAAFAQVMREQREVTWEETRSSATGQQQLLLRYRPMRGVGGELRVISSGIDITERKQAEEEIAKQREFYESILGLLPVDIAVFDAAHRFLYVNPSSISDPELRQQIIGMSNAEYFELRGEKQLAGLAKQREEYFDLAVRTRTDVTWEEMRTDRFQRPQLLVRHLRPVFAADGTLRMVVGSGIDITARYTAEKLQHEVQAMLQAQQDFIRQILDALPNALHIVAPDGRVSFSNHAFDSIIAHGRHWQKTEAGIAGQEETPQMQVLNEQVRATFLPQTHELPFTLTSGETRHYQVHKRPLPRADGQVDVLTVSTDITAVKEARHELERREKQYHDLVYYSQALICTLDMAGKVLSVNPAIEKVMGLPAAQLVGSHLRDVLLPEHRAELDAYLRGKREEHPQPHVVAVRTSAGELRYLNYYTYQVAEEGHPPYVVASGYDVTRGVLAQRALQLAKQEAEENAQAKEAFLARMSHEIRTPLNGVLGMAGLLQKTPLDVQQREYLNTMQHAGQHLLALLNDVLDMAKITTQHLRLDHAPFDLAVVLHGAGQTVAALAEQKGLQLQVEPLPLAAPRVLGDAYRLHQVLLNLLSNAIKFTETGHVRLGVDVLRDLPHELTLRFWVEDTGVGISSEEQAHIFDVFTQVSAETSSRLGGTGLGLAISQQLVSQMGGVLRLCSQAGQGTTFSFQLTMARPVGAASQPPPATTETSFDGLRGLRVLLAEDNLVNQWIAVVVLENWGVLVKPVSNGTDALEQLLHCEYDAAILDIKMPGLSGVEVTTAIRANPQAACATIPIIALTANAFQADRASYLAAGMNACLTKPYEEADLCRLLLQLTANPRQSS